MSHAAMKITTRNLSSNLEVTERLPPEDSDDVGQQQDEAHVGREAFGALVYEHASDLENKSNTRPDYHA